MKVLSHPGHCLVIVLHPSLLHVFHFLEDVSPVIQKASSALTNRRGVAGFLNLCGSVLAAMLRTRLSS